MRIKHKFSFWWGMITGTLNIITGSCFLLVGPTGLGLFCYLLGCVCVISAVGLHTSTASDAIRDMFKSSRYVHKFEGGCYVDFSGIRRIARRYNSEVGPLIYQLNQIIINDLHRQATRNKG